MQVDIVSAEKEIFSGSAEMVFAPAIQGEIGIAPGHTPLLTLLGPGEIRVKISEEEEASFYVSGGMIPKLEACLHSLSKIQEAHIIDGRKEGALFSVVTKNNFNKGTLIVN